MKISFVAFNMKKLGPISLRYLMTLMALAFISFSCKEDDDPTANPPVSNAANVHVNEWVYENMDFWYLWNTDLVEDADKNQDPATYFKSILSSNDRFSWIQNNYQELLNSLKGINKEAGYEYVLYRDKENENNVIAQVLYVKPNSPAEQAGLVRGDIISFINDQQLTFNNYKELIGKLKENHTIRYKSVDPVTETFSEEKILSLTTVEYSENPNHMTKVIDANGRKVGYYVYTLFAGGPGSSSTVYDDQMDQIFADFKNQGITDLVLDLRFNSGGAESSANKLASLIGKGVNSTKVFAKREYNAGVTDAILKDPDMGSDFLTRKFETKAANIGNQLTDGRVYILTSSRSASASELVINSLRPYMDVFIIGDTTYGKNVGSISLYDEADTKNTWGMQPIVVKIYNSLNESNYSEGFVPNFTHKDNRLYLYPLGDPREILLADAIAQITGTASSGRAPLRGDERELIGHSLDNKRGSFNLVIDDFLKQ